MKNFELSIWQKLYFYIIPSQPKRTKYLIKHKVFAEVGENFFFQPHKLPADPKFIKFHNNVVVTADVTFVSHDVLYCMFRNIDKRHTVEHIECTEIFDNVFIGLGSIILPGVKIGPNAIIAAGSVITKDVPEGSVVGGNPAKVIGNFETLMEKRLNETLSYNELNITGGRNDADRLAYEWLNFNKN